MTTIEKRIVKENMGMRSLELLNWSMNQLFRAARTIDLLSIGAKQGPGKHCVASGCDCTATVILKKLARNRKGYDLVKQTNPKLLRGYRKPITLTCTDCGCEPWWMGEDFYVKDSLWQSTMPKYKRNKIICIGCFEKRLGRKLRKSDFKKWFLGNRTFSGDRIMNDPPSERLRNRLQLPA